MIDFVNRIVPVVASTGPEVFRVICIPSEDEYADGEEGNALSRNDAEVKVPVRGSREEECFRRWIPG